MTYNRTDIETAIQLLTAPSATHELRVLGSEEGVVTGIFTETNEMIEAALEWNSKGHGVYMTLNPIKPSHRYSSLNYMIPHAKKTISDADISSLRWFLIDVDPKRPSHTPSTKEEHALALKTASQIRKWLGQREWPDPIWFDSGNGAHLVYRIELLNSDENVAKLKACLRSLAAMFDDERVVVDRATYNPSRICRLPGTLNKKGPNTPQRPHRVAKIFKTPRAIVAVPEEKIAALCAMFSETSSQRDRQTFNLHQWITDQGLEVAADLPWSQGRKWVLSKCPWKPEKHTDRAAFIVQLSNGAIAAGCHHKGCSKQNWHSLRDKLEPGWQSKRSGSKENHLDRLIQITESLDVFRDNRGELYMVVGDNNAKENLLIRSSPFRSLLIDRFYGQYGTSPKADTLNSVISILEARCRRKGERVELSTRFGSRHEEFWLDLCDENGTAINITASGWDIVPAPPKLFRQFNHQKSLVRPDPNGSIHDLSPFLNLRDPQDELLLHCWLVSTLVPNIPRPILCLIGPHGTAKSTLAKMVKHSVDPSQYETLQMHREADQLAQVFDHNALPLFDNVTHLTEEQSNLLCQAVTGGGFSKRQLYSDSSDVFFSFKRPILMTAINSPIKAPDLLDRTLFMTTKMLTSQERKEESQLWRDFEKAKPRILGGILNTLSQALKLYPTINPKNLSRMADFERWGLACTQALGRSQTDFKSALSKNTNNRLNDIIDADPLAQSIIAFAKKKRKWSGSATHLLKELIRRNDGDDDKSWPKSASNLTRRLRPLQPCFLGKGVSIDLDQRSSGQRYIEIKFQGSSS